MIYQGNLINTPEEIVGKGFLADDGCTYSDLPVIGWNIVEIQTIGKIYKDGVLIDIPKTKEELNAPILEQIQAIEAKKIRALTDFVLNGSKSYLEKYETDIQVLRKQLV